MKKKGIVITVIGIFVIISLILIVGNSDKPKTFKKDGVLIALTVDGTNQTSFPSRGNYKVDIDCKNGKGKWLVDEWKFAVEEITGNVTCNVNFTTKTDADNLTTKITNMKGSASGIGSVVDEGNAGIRYEGQNPNNYIWFNNEIWRIIGVIPTKNASGTNENLVKILRNESLGGFAYDAKNYSGFTGSWGSNTLYTLLNSYYWGRKSGTNTAYCYGNQATSKNKCDYQVNGIKNTDYYGSMARQVYWNTGASDKAVTTSTAYTNEIKKQTVKGYVGLMNASDYGYATSASHDTTINRSNSVSTLGNWLYTSEREWTITQYSNDSSCALYMLDGIMTDYYANAGYGVRPVVYLDSKVYIVSGDGSEANPYIVAMES